MRGIEEDEKGRAIKSKRIEEGKRKRGERKSTAQNTKSTGGSKGGY